MWDVVTSWAVTQALEAIAPLALSAVLGGAAWWTRGGKYLGKGLAALAGVVALWGAYHYVATTNYNAGFDAGEAAQLATTNAVTRDLNEALSKLDEEEAAREAVEQLYEENVNALEDELEAERAFSDDGSRLSDERVRRLQRAARCSAAGRC